MQMYRRGCEEDLCHPCSWSAGTIRSMQAHGCRYPSLCSAGGAGSYPPPPPVMTIVTPPSPPTDCWMVYETLAPSAAAVAAVAAVSPTVVPVPELGEAMDVDVGSPSAPGVEAATYTTGGGLDTAEGTAAVSALAATMPPVLADSDGVAAWLTGALCASLGALPDEMISTVPPSPDEMTTC